MQGLKQAMQAKRVAGSARGIRRPPASHQNLVSWTLSIVTLPVPQNPPGKRMMSMHIRQMHQQLLADSKACAITESRQ